MWVDLVGLIGCPGPFAVVDARTIGGGFIFGAVTALSGIQRSAAAGTDTVIGHGYSSFSLFVTCSSTSAILSSVSAMLAKLVFA